VLKPGSLGRPGLRLLKAQLRGRPGAPLWVHDPAGTTHRGPEGNWALRAYRSQERAEEEKEGQADFVLSAEPDVGLDPTALGS